MNAVSDIPRRNLLAQHFREVVDILGLKVEPNISHLVPTLPDVSFTAGDGHCFLRKQNLENM